MTPERVSDDGRLYAGATLDRYELLMPIAEGGMASLWLARQTGKYGFEKLVAIKTILPKYASEPGFQRMFLDEARLASNIDHPNIARVLDLGEDDGVLFLVMEWLDGESLTSLGRSAAKKSIGGLPLGVLLRILADVCAGLQAAHDAVGLDGNPLHLVHRDVSPHNMLVGFNGVTRVIDFGIAKASDRVCHETRAGVVKGKVAYMSPEQAMGRPVDGRTDLWAVGATMYRYLVGETPYGSAGGTIETLRAIMARERPKPAPSSVPGPLRAILSKALEFDADRRFASGEEMRLAIVDAMAHLDVETSHAEVAEFMETALGDARSRRSQTINQSIRTMRARPRLESDPAKLPGADRASDMPSARPSGKQLRERDVAADGPLAEVEKATVEPLDASRFPSATMRSATKEQRRAKTVVKSAQPTYPPNAARLVTQTDPGLTPASLTNSIPVPLRNRRLRSKPIAQRTALVGALLGISALGWITRAHFEAPGTAHAESIGHALVVSSPPVVTSSANGDSVADHAPQAAVPAPPSMASVGLVSRPVLPAEVSSVIKPAPRTLRDLVDSGNQALRAGDARGAEALFAAALTRAPSDSEALTGFAEARAAGGAFSAAIAGYQKAVAANPRYLPARLGLADALWESGQRAAAKSAYASLVDDFPPGRCPERARIRAGGPEAAATPPVGHD